MLKKKRIKPYEILRKYKKKKGVSCVVITKKERTTGVNNIDKENSLNIDNVNKKFNLKVTLWKS